MFLTRKRAFARAGLLGNPSDGYHGKTVSFSVRNYWAEVVLYEWDSVEIVLVSSRDGEAFAGRVAQSGAVGFIAKADLDGPSLRALLGSASG